MTSEELKPCPFCGGKAHIKKISIGFGLYYKARCRNEKCSAAIENGEEETMEAAVAAWNHRAGDAEVARLREVEVIKNRLRSAAKSFSNAACASHLKGKETAWAEFNAALAALTPAEKKDVR